MRVANTGVVCSRGRDKTNGVWGEGGGHGIRDSALDIALGISAHEGCELRGVKEVRCVLVVSTNLGIEVADAVLGEHADFINALGPVHGHGGVHARVVTQDVGVMVNDHVAFNALVVLDALERLLDGTLFVGIRGLSERERDGCKGQLPGW